MLKIGGITMENNSQKSMLELAVEIVKKAGAPKAINEIIEEALKAKGIEDTNGDKKASLYVDITTSSDFVYMGEGCWDLKSNQSLDEYDKDGSDFNDVSDETNEDVKAEDYNTDDDEITSDDEENTFEEESEDYDGKNPYADDSDMEAEDTDESEFDDIRDTPDADDFDEDKYGSIMDSYEDLYDK